MTNGNKKGFTIVELVIVIAVIAILAAALIPTFSGVIDKANQSSDQQVVKQMNTILAVEAASGDTPSRIHEVKALLLANGYTLDTTTFKGYSYAWIAEKNVIALVEDGEVVFPKEYSGYDKNKLAFFNIAKAGSSEEIKALADGNFSDLKGLNSIVLENDVTVQLDEGKDYLLFKTAGDIEIDGNGKTIQANIDVSISTSLALTNVTINGSSGAASAIKPTAGDVFMSGATIIGEYYAFAQNAGDAAASGEDVVCDIKNSTFDAPIALYISEGTWTFENCEFNGTVTIAGGANIVFNNCKFTAKPVDACSWSYDANNALGHGCFFSAYAIVIEDGRDINSWQSGKVTFNKCTVTNATDNSANYAYYNAGASNPNTLEIVWN